MIDEDGRARHTKRNQTNSPSSSGCIPTRSKGLASLSPFGDNFNLDLEILRQVDIAKVLASLPKSFVTLKKRKRQYLSRNQQSVNFYVKSALLQYFCRLLQRGIITNNSSNLNFGLHGVSYCYAKSRPFCGKKERVEPHENLNQFQ